MKNPFKHRGVTPALLFIQFAMLLSFGILCIVNSDLAFSLLQWVAAGTLGIAGISRGWGLISDKKILHGVLTLLLFLAGSTVMVLFPLLIAGSAGLLFGLWFLVTGFIQATVFLQCLTQKMKGRVRSGTKALLSIIFGFFLVIQPAHQMHTVFLLAGIYLIIYSVTVLIDAVSEIFLHGTKGARVKTKVRISLPLFLTALLPGKLLDEFNSYFQLNPKEAAAFLQRPDVDFSEKAPLEIFVHLSDRGIQRTGHVDIRYRDTVLSYGCYDHHAHKLGGMVSDGTMVLCESQKYIEYCIQEEEKILVSFGLALTKEQCVAVEEEIKKITDNLIPWQSDFEKGVANMEQPDPASQLVAETGAKVYKMGKGPFRKYYALNTNCVKLADQIIGTSGLGLICVGGIAVPGSYYTMLNDLYEKNNSLVIERNVYKQI